MPFDTPTTEARKSTLAKRRDGWAWPAWFTTEQKQAQIDHEAKGCPPPWPGAVWNGYEYRTPKTVAVA